MLAMMCAVFDTAVSKYMAPWYAQNEEDAKRSFKFIMSQNDMMKQNPSDYECYMVGTWDDENGVLPVDIPKKSYTPIRLFKGGEVFHEYTDKGANQI